MMEKLIRKVLNRRNAYRAIFRPGGMLTPAGEIVLADLAKFCRATVSTTAVSRVTGCVDPIASAQAEGRREVWLRLTQHLQLNDADIYRMMQQQQDELTE